MFKRVTSGGHEHNNLYSTPIFAYAKRNSTGLGKEECVRRCRNGICTTAAHVTNERSLERKRQAWEPLPSLN